MERNIIRASTITMARRKLRSRTEAFTELHCSYLMNSLLLSKAADSSQFSEYSSQAESSCRTDGPGWYKGPIPMQREPRPSVQSPYRAYRSSPQSYGLHEARVLSEHKKVQDGLQFTTTTPTSINQRGASQSLCKILGSAPAVVTMGTQVGARLEHPLHTSPAIGNDVADRLSDAHARSLRLQARIFTAILDTVDIFLHSCRNLRWEQRCGTGNVLLSATPKRFFF
ncbi:hypothetical protein SAY87_000541 [Trapa incisa]|uniref:Uncharacterized protein n=1 Tax=Trapa incisa TaxID=236973 RepID=A0AAN7JH27_9MYRT|nr:hypothetical protein SAY87_000541 [Trapa incisa]